MINAEIWKNPWMRALGALTGVLLFLAGLYILRTVLVPLLFAFIVAYAFDPVVDYLETLEIPRLRRKIPRMAAVVALVLALLLAVLSFPVIVLPGMYIEAGRLVESARQDADHNWMDRFLDRLPLRTIVQELGWAPEGQEEFNERAVMAAGLGKLVRARVAGFLHKDADAPAGAESSAGASAAAVFVSVTNGILKVILFIGNFALFAFVAIYLLRDYDRIIVSAHNLIPLHKRDRVEDIMRRIDIQLRAFMRGQMAVCACLGLMYAIGLGLSGTPFALQLAIFGGVASFVPYLGLALTILPAMILTALRHGVDAHLLGVLLTFGAAQAIESNFLTPRIVGSQVGLNPVWIILAIMVFGSLLGFVGLLLAVPMAAVLKVLVVEAVAYYRASPWFVGADPGGEGES